MGRGEGDGTVEEKRQEPGEDLRERSGDGVAEASGPDGATRGGWRTGLLVFGVFVIPILLYAAIPAVSALLIPPGRKVALSAAFMISAEGTFLVSALFGREAVRRYLNLRTPLGRSEKG